MKKAIILVMQAIFIILVFTPLASTNVFTAEFDYFRVYIAPEWTPILDYSDEFNSFVLDPKWSFVNPAPYPYEQSWSLTSNPGFLTMTTTGPTDIFGETNTSPRMLENAPADDFGIVVRVLAAPAVLFEHAGILVIQSPTEWVRLIRDSRYNSVALQSWGSTGFSEAYIPYSGYDVILKLTKTGSVYEGAFSVDGGLNFIVIGEINGPAFPIGIGTVVASTPDDGNHGNHLNSVPGLTYLSLFILILLTIVSFIGIRKANLPI